MVHQLNYVKYIVQGLINTIRNWKALSWNKREISKITPRFFQNRTDSYPGFPGLPELRMINPGSGSWQCCTPTTASSTARPRTRPGGLGSIQWTRLGFRTNEHEWYQSQGFLWLWSLGRGHLSSRAVARSNQFNPRVWLNFEKFV